MILNGKYLIFFLFFFCHSDVVGNLKGQGQDSNTTNSRHKKDVNKSTRANHNRRQGAAFKRNRGMIPS